MCKFIMATMYKCKGKGMCMTTSKCNSKKALLCVSSKLSSWSRKKSEKRRTLCASTKPSSQPTKRAPASESRKSCGRQFLQICERPFVYWQSLLYWLCVRWIVITRSRQSVILLPCLALNWKKTHFKFTQSYSFHKCCLYHQVEICPCQNLWFSNFANNLWQESKKSLAVFIQ